MLEHGDAGDEVVGEEVQEQGQEARTVRTRTAPRPPSAEEVRQHSVTHLPFRNWCPHCVAARGRNFPHSRIREESQCEYPVVHFDYCFPRNEVGGETVPVLVGRVSDSKALLGHVVPAKGAGVEWTVKQIIKDLQKMGLHGTVVLKSDQEPAIVDLMKSVAKERGEARTLIEHSPVADSQGNGTRGNTQANSTPLEYTTGRSYTPLAKGQRI